MGRPGRRFGPFEFHGYRMGNRERIARTQRPHLAQRKAAGSWSSRVARFPGKRCQIIRLETGRQRAGNVRHDFSLLLRLQSRYYNGTWLCVCRPRYLIDLLFANRCWSAAALRGFGKVNGRDHPRRHQIVHEPQNRIASSLRGNHQRHGGRSRLCPVPFDSDS